MKRLVLFAGLLAAVACESNPTSAAGAVRVPKSGSAPAVETTKTPNKAVTNVGLGEKPSAAVTNVGLGEKPSAAVTNVGLGEKPSAAVTNVGLGETPAPAP